VIGSSDRDSKGVGDCNDQSGEANEGKHHQRPTVPNHDAPHV
jgi:hypothetical protein